MKYCPITYEEISDAEIYSQRGLKLLSPQLKILSPLPYSAAEQRSESLARAGKMSIQGVQTKLSAQLKIKDGRFDVVDRYGTFILKPQSEYYPELPENEAITMTLAAQIGIAVPVHGLVYSKDNTLTYFIKRFDRKGHGDKLSVEDFAQLSQASRDTKYKSSMEKVVRVLNEFCTFPRIEGLKLFKITLFNFLIGNEDMHLKNFSLITRNNKVMLTPAYDLLNSSIVLGNTKEEIALPLNGKKNNLRKSDLVNYFGIELLKLNNSVINTELELMKQTVPHWKLLIGRSFLSPGMQEKYLRLLDDRLRRLEF